MLREAAHGMRAGQSMRASTGSWPALGQGADDLAALLAAPDEAAPVQASAADEDGGTVYLTPASAGCGDGGALPDSSRRSGDRLLCSISATGPSANLSPEQHTPGDACLCSDVASREHPESVWASRRRAHLLGAAASTPRQRSCAAHPPAQNATSH